MIHREGEKTQGTRDSTSKVTSAHRSGLPEISAARFLCLYDESTITAVALHGGVFTYEKTSP